MQKVSFEEVYENKYIRESVRSVAGQVAQSFPVLASYTDDMEQELWIAINKALGKFSREGNASIESFFRGLIDRRIKNIRKKFLAQVYPDDVATEDIESEEAQEVAGTDNVLLAMMQMDVQTVIRSLSPELRQVCEWIMDGVTMTQIAKRLGMSESKFYYQYVYPLREAFRKEGLDNYLEIM